MRLLRPAPAALLLAAALTPGCAYFNTLYNAQLRYDEAQDIQDAADPERLKISPGEERLYSEAFEKAAKVVKFYPESKWVDDAVLLMGKASFQKGDYSTAVRKFDELLEFFPNSKLVPEAVVMLGRTHVATGELEAASAALARAGETREKQLRDDVTYFLGVVEAERGNEDQALAAFGELVSHHRKSEWFAGAGLRAGEIAARRGDFEGAVAFYERVRSGGRTLEERYLGGVKKGEALLAMGEYERAVRTFHDLSERSFIPDNRGNARVLKAKALLVAGDRERAIEEFHRVLEKYERRQAAADAQLALARIVDEDGALEQALDEYALVKEQGTAHAAWREASERRTQIQRVLDLRSAVADAESDDRDRNRFLLAEQLLERIGNVDGALAEYASLAAEAGRTEWGQRALFAEAWVREHRLGDAQAADSLLFRLANHHAGTEVAAAARRRFGFPVWQVEHVEAPPVKLVRMEQDPEEEPQEVVLERVEPREVPFERGIGTVRVWIRVTVGHDGTATGTQVVKSAGAGMERFDAASLEAALASRYLPPSEGGPEFQVMQYAFEPGTGATPPPAPEEDGPALPTIRDRTVERAADD